MTPPEQESSPVAPASSGSFPTTQWSVVLHAGHDKGTRGQAALESLCQRYWYPLYVFARRQGRTHHEAEDSTQEFLARLLAGEGMTHARPDRGRFRTFLLTSLRNFLINEWQCAQAAKRGGGKLLSLDLAAADGRFGLEPVDPALTPEQAFDRSWALDLIARVLDGLRAEHVQRGQGERFELLAAVLWPPGTPAEVDRQAARAGLSLPTFTVALHRLRRRLGERLRAEVSETVAEGSDTDAELRHLITAVGGRATGT